MTRPELDRAENLAFSVSNVVTTLGAKLRSGYQPNPADSAIELLYHEMDNSSHECSAFGAPNQ